MVRSLIAPGLAARAKILKSLPFIVFIESANILDSLRIHPIDSNNNVPVFFHISFNSS